MSGLKPSSFLCLQVSSDVPRILGVASNHSPTADGHNEASTVFATIQPAMFELGDGVSMVDEAAPVLDGSTNVSPAPALPSDELASTRGLEVSSVEMKSLDPDWLPNTEARPISKRSKVHKVPDVEATVLVGRFMCWMWRLLCWLVVLCVGCGGYCAGWSFYVLDVEATVQVGRFMC